MADHQQNPNMMVHSTNGVVDTTSNHSSDDNHIDNNNNNNSNDIGRRGNASLLGRNMNNNGSVIVSSTASSSTSSSVLLPSVSASASSTVHALADSVMIPFSASDLDVLRASLAATNSFNNGTPCSIVTSNPSGNNNINVCINAGNIIVNADGHLSLDGATNALLNGISSSSMVACPGNVSSATGASDLLHSNVNEISSNSGNNLDQQQRLSNIANNSDQFYNASSSCGTGLENVDADNNIGGGDNNIICSGDNDNSGVVSILSKNIGILNNNENRSCSGVVSTAHIPISVASILANVNVDSGLVTGATPSGFLLSTQNQNSNANGSALNQNYMTLRNQISLSDGNNNIANDVNGNCSNRNSSRSKTSHKSSRSLLSSGCNSLLQQNLRKEQGGSNDSISSLSAVVGSSSGSSNIGSAGGSGNVRIIRDGAITISSNNGSGSGITERTATANIHHLASGHSSISSSSGRDNGNGRQNSLSSQMNQMGRVVSSSETVSTNNSDRNNVTIEVHAGYSQQGHGQTRPSSSSSSWLPQHQQTEHQNFQSNSHQTGLSLGVRGATIRGSRGSSSSTSSLTSTVDLQQPGNVSGLVSISVAGELSQQQAIQMAGTANNSVQHQNQHFPSLFQIPVQHEGPSETFQAAAHSTFDQQTAGPSNVTVHQFGDLALGGDSEATPSYPTSMQQQHHQIIEAPDNLAESLNITAPIVDSSTLQSYNLVYDAETRRITVQRVISPSDSTVSQSTLSLESSEATPNSNMMPMVSQGYAMVQVNPMPSSFSSGGSGATGAAVASGRGVATGSEVSTSSMGVVIDIDDPGNNRSAVEMSLDGASSSAQNMVVLHHKLEDSGLDDTAECDTTQEDVEFQDPQSPPPYPINGTTSNSIDDDVEDEVTSLDSSTPDTPVSSLAHRLMSHHLLRGQSSSSSAASRGKVMDTTLNSNQLSSVIAMDTTGNPIISMDGGQASLSSSTPGSSASVVFQQQQHQHQNNSQMMQSAADVLPSTSGLQAFDSAVAGPSQVYPEFQHEDRVPHSSGLGMHIRKSRRLELQEQEPRASQRKKDNSYRTQNYDVNQLWCDECMLSYEFECPIHRLCPVADKVVLSRAWASCPTQLQICRLVDTAYEAGEADIGVFAKRQVAKLTQFGPFIGQLVDSLDDVAVSQFPLMLEVENQVKKYFDTSDENLCNWMMFVRPAKTFAEQNVVAFQFKEQVYFTVTKTVEAKQELKVWYAAHYAERLDLKPLALTEEDLQVLDESDAKFPCFECSRRFRSSATLQIHLESVHENEDLLELDIDGDGSRDGLMANMMADKEDGDYKAPIKGFDRQGKEFDEDGGKGRGRRKGKRKGVFVNGKLIQGKGKSRQGDTFQWKKKSTNLYINKTLKKYKKRVQYSDKGPSSGRSSMYTRQGKDSGGNEWVCTHCGLTFDKRSLLNLHTLTHAAEDLVAGEEGMMQINQAKTEFCEEEVNQEEGGIMSFSPMIACPKCSVIFSDQRDLMNHVATHAQKPIKREKPFDCQHCSKSFPTEEKLVRHSIVHGADEDKPLECTVCQRRLVNNAAMACHMKTHSDRKYYDCPVCTEDFDSSLVLKDHAQRQHTDANGHYPCPNCIKIFDDFQMLKRHVKAFHSRRVFECEYCAKEFCRLDKLKLHMLKHTSHREFMCDQCGRQFKRKDKLREHTKRLHNKERMAEGHGFRMGGRGAKKFVPKVMPSEYHRFIYKCHSCLLGFKRRGMLVNHLAKRHPDMKPEHVPELNLPILKTQKDFYCQYCDKIYKSSSKRKAHILKNHPGSLVPPSARKKQPLTDDATGVATGTVLACATVGANGQQQQVLPLNTFSHTVGSITTMPHGCKFCHKQYASKAKLLQHQRKKHTDLVEPSSAKKKSKPFKSEYLQITVGDPTVGSLINERYETVPMVTVVTQPAPGGDQLTGPADLLTQAMSEIQQSYGADFAATLNPRLTAGNNNTTMVQIQPSPLAQTIDINQLNQALQSMTSAASHGGVTTVLAPPANLHASILAPQQQQQQQQQQPHPVQLSSNTQPSSQQLQQGVQLVAAGGPAGQSNTINLNGLGGSQFITRSWHNSFTSQFS